MQSLVCCRLAAAKATQSFGESGPQRCDYAVKVNYRSISHRSEPTAVQLLQRTLLEAHKSQTRPSPTDFFTPAAFVGKKLGLH